MKRTQRQSKMDGHFGRSEEFIEHIRFLTPPKAGIRNDGYPRRGGLGMIGSRAFTLIELLTVIAIIAMLIGIMAVGVKMATRQAKNLRQKTELRAMDIGLELFSKDFDDYPDSKVRGPDKGGPPVCGAQHLAEALVGRDSHGFEPQTGWYPPPPDGDKIYKPGLDAAVLNTLYDANSDVSLRRRKGPYVELKHSGVYTIAELWQGSVAPSTIYPSPAPPVPAANGRLLSPVITDTFNLNTITLSGASVKVGLPVLYFKADSAKRFRVDKTTNPVTNPATAEYSQWIYNFDDNLPVVQLPRLDGQTDTDFTNPAEATKNQAEIFYEMLTQTADTGRNYYKPFNANKFILISAGWDGVYGTKDDITNFDY